VVRRNSRLLTGLQSPSGPSVKTTSPTLSILTASLGPGSELCAICRAQRSSRCVECEATSLDADANNSCEVAWGVCNHGFHLHCINKWLRTRAVCPLDNRDWQFQS